MKKRFEGEGGRRLLLSGLAEQKLFSGLAEAANEVVDKGNLLQFETGDVIIEQGTETNEIYFIIAGTCDVLVNGRRLGTRGPGDHVGEMAAIQPAQPRSATIVASGRVVAIQLTEEKFSDITSRNPQIYRSIAQELSRRLLQRNRTVGEFREQIRVFVICSVESLPVARVITSSFEYDPFAIEVWNEGCFKVANYTLQDLEAAVDRCDFAIAIAHADDVVSARDTEWPAPRDNVIFELGLFMGRLGRARAILMEPRSRDVKLPSDLAGITTIPYRFEKQGENERLMAPACNRLRDHIRALGPNNG